MPSTFLGARATLSSAVRWGKRLNDWKTIPTLRRRSFTRAPGAVISSSPRKIRPAVGISSRFRQRRSVDFPEPEGPMTHTTSPLATSRSTPSRTVWSP